MKQLWLASLFLLTTAAELPQARLWTVFPAGGKAGSTVEISVTGADLDNATNLLFSAAGITATPKVVAGSTNIEPNKFVVTIASEAPLGRSEARVAGRFGASNPRSFIVGSLPEVNETEPNNSLGETMKISLPVIVNGAADAENYDTFKFEAKKDQRLLFRSLTREIDSRLSPTLLLFDPQGHELARSRKGGFLEFIPPTDGEYVLQIHDQLFKGGAEYGYRIEAGALPHLDFVEPAFGSPGTKTSHRLLGRNLPGGKPTSLKGHDGKLLDEAAVEIEFPPVNRLSAHGLKANVVGIEGFPYILRSDELFSNPYPLTFMHGNAIQQKHDSSPVQVTVPTTYHGRFRPVREAEWLQFSAEKGEVFWLELLSERLGFPTDPHLLVQRITRNDKGEAQYGDVKELYDVEQNLGGREFNTATRDVVLRFDAPEKGDYRVQARDLFNLIPGKASYPYQLQVRKESPGFELAIAPYAPPNPNKDARTVPVWSHFLRRGDKQPIKILVSRKDGFNGEIGLVAEGLPKGVTLAPLTIPPGVSTATVFFQSAVDAQPFTGPLKIVGRAKIGDKDVQAEAIALTQLWNVEDHGREEIISRTAVDNVLAVSSYELAPVSVDPAEEKTWETTLGGKITIPINITRRGEFNNNLKFQLLTDPLKEWEVDGKATNTSVEVEIKTAKLGVGRHNLALLAQTTGKYRRVSPEEQKQIEEEIKTLQGQRDSEARLKDLNARIAPADVSATFWSSPVAINVTPSPVQVQLAANHLELKPGAKNELNVRISRLYDYKEAVEVTVVLPQEIKGLAVAKVTIPAEQSEGKLVFESATDAAPGEKKVIVTVLARQNGLELKSEVPLTLLIGKP